MAKDPFTTRYEDLPEILPVFPLSQVILLPGGRLPLNVFEPRYLALVQAALAHDRLFGMIQPLDEEVGGDAPPLYSVGSVGRIVHFSETEARQMFVVLHGVCRFRVLGEAEGAEGFRRLRVDYAPFREDVAVPGGSGLDASRERLNGVLKRFVEAHALEVDLRALESLSLPSLVVTLSMALPFEAPEKQALLEAQTLERRYAALCALMEMGAVGGTAGDAPQ
mgnify:CR=1 FL=1